mgnify:CR=1 FL=1
MSGELAARRITPAELDEIQALHFEMLAAWTRRDLSNYYRLNALIHAAINAAAKNPVLAATLGLGLALRIEPSIPIIIHRKFAPQGGGQIDPATRDRAIQGRTRQRWTRIRKRRGRQGQA